MAIVYVGERHNVSKAGALSPTLSPSAGLTAGNLAVMCFCVSGGTAVTVTSVTDDAGNTWTIDKRSDRTTNVSAVIASSILTTSLTTSSVITINCTGTGGIFGVLLEEYSGIAPATPLDQTGAANGSGTAVSVTSLGATGQADELVIACAAMLATTAFTPAAPFTGFTTPSISAARSLGGEYETLAATGTPTATGTIATAAWAAALATYKAAAAAGAPVNTVAPAVTGTARVGQTLSCDTGTWTG